MRIIFMGTPEFSVPVLDALVAAGHEIAAVYTQPPRPAGRGKKDRPQAVHLRALELGLPVRYPVSLRNPQAHAEFADLNADIAVVVLRVDPAAGGAGCPASGVPEYPRLTSSTLAGCGPDPPRDHGGGCADRRLHHADGGGVGYRPGPAARSDRYCAR